MSESAALDYTLSECPVTAFRPSSVVELSNGVKNSLLREFPAVSGTNNSSVQFQVAIPPNHFLGPDVIIRLPVEIVVKNSVTTAEALPARCWSFSQAAAYRIIDSMKLVLNGVSLEKNICQIIPHLIHYEDMSNDNPKLVDQYCTPDFVQNYSEYFNSGATDVTKLLSSPFALFGDNAYGKYLPRTQVDSLVHNTTDKTSKITTNLYISLPFSSFSYGGVSLGISQLSTLNVGLSLNSRHEELINRPPLGTNTITDVSMTFTSAPVLTASFYQPSDFITKTMLDPKTNQWAPQTLSFARHTVYNPGASIAIAAGGVATMQSAPIILTSIPKKIYVAAVRMRYKGQKDFNTVMTDEAVVSTPAAYGLIEKVELNLSGTNAVGSMPVYNLYSQSSRAGLNIPWAAAKQAGFVACFDLANGDIGIQDAGLLGIRSSIPLQVNATVKNLDTADHSYEFLVIVEGEEYVHLQNGQGYHRTSIHLEDDVKNQILQSASDEIKSTKRVIGGSFLSGLFKWVPRIAKALYTHGPAVLNTLKGNGFTRNTIGGSTTIDGTSVLGPAALTAADFGKKKRGGGVDSSTPATGLKPRIL